MLLQTTLLAFQHQKAVACCAQDVQLALQLLPLPGQLGALSRVGEALGMMQPLRVGLASLIFSGRVRVALKPLMNKLPIVAAMQARSTCSCVQSLVGSFKNVHGIAMNMNASHNVFLRYLLRMRSWRL